MRAKTNSDSVTIELTRQITGISNGIHELMSAITSAKYAVHKLMRGISRAGYASNDLSNQCIMQF